MDVLSSRQVSIHNFHIWEYTNFRFFCLLYCFEQTQHSHVYVFNDVKLLLNNSLLSLSTKTYKMFICICKVALLSMWMCICVPKAYLYKCSYTFICKTSLLTQNCTLKLLTFNMAYIIHCTCIKITRASKFRLQMTWLKNLHSLRGRGGG